MKSSPMSSPALIAGLLLIALGCASSVPPKVRVVTPIADFGRGSMYLEANRDEARIAESLRSAGLIVAPAPHGADLTLKALLGKSRGSSPCGSVHNAQYQLWQGKYLILKIVARGPIGHCPESMVDQVAYEIDFFLDSNRMNVVEPAAVREVRQDPVPPTAPAPPAPAATPPPPEVTEPVRTDVPRGGTAPPPRPQLGGAD